MTDDIIITESNGQALSSELITKIKRQQIFWSDDRLCLFFFDFPFKDMWISSKEIAGDLSYIVVNLYR